MNRQYQLNTNYLNWARVYVDDHANVVVKHDDFHGRYRSMTALAAFHDIDLNTHVQGRMLEGRVIWARLIDELDDMQVLQDDIIAKSNEVACELINCRAWQVGGDTFELVEQGNDANGDPIAPVRVRNGHLGGFIFQPQGTDVYVQHTQLGMNELEGELIAQRTQMLILSQQIDTLIFNRETRKDAFEQHMFQMLPHIGNTMEEMLTGVYMDFPVIANVEFDPISRSYLRGGM